MRPRSGFLRFQLMPERHLLALISKGRLWILSLLCVASLFLISTYVQPRLISSGAGQGYADREMASRVVINEILSLPTTEPETAKIAFMFLTPGPLPFEELWELFFRSHEAMFSIYVHASEEKTEYKSQYFKDRDIPSKTVEWGHISMVDAEKRLLATALDDPDNQHFVLLSDSCIPLHKFDYVYEYLVNTNISFIDSFRDPGYQGNGRYSDQMLPEVPLEDFRKGAQWFTMNRKHALIVMADSLYYPKFRDHCGRGIDGHNCYPDEHYLPTFFHMVNPAGVSNWSVTHVDWSEHKYHSKSYTARDVTFALIRNLTDIDEITHETSEDKIQVQRRPCVWNGTRRPCHLFARKFLPETLDVLMQIFTNYIST